METTTIKVETERMTPSRVKKERKLVRAQSLQSDQDRFFDRYTSARGRISGR